MITIWLLFEIKSIYFYFYLFILQIRPTAGEFTKEHYVPKKVDPPSNHSPKKSNHNHINKSTPDMQYYFIKMVHTPKAR